MTFLGDLGKPQEGRVGDAPYRYPVVDAVRLYIVVHGAGRGGTPDPPRDRGGFP
ncbi:MAG: hypothetical protein B7Z66_04530 [Chromatiales bacterium 21-64-14]|nr:MAG: hypothetical protein B7Z66_04530 [Chromatiales bacterium 21-64-14]